LIDRWIVWHHLRSCRSLPLHPCRHYISHWLVDRCHKKEKLGVSHLVAPDSNAKPRVLRKASLKLYLWRIHWQSCSHRQLVIVILSHWKAWKGRGWTHIK
jgi:hypothetical protein